MKLDDEVDGKSKNFDSHFEAASNLSFFFFRRHFHGLKSRPSALNLLFRSSGGVLVPVLRLVVRSVVPLCFFTKTKTKTREEKIKFRLRGKFFVRLRDERRETTIN